MLGIHTKRARPRAGFVALGLAWCCMSCGAAEPPPGVVRVACVGDSITYGDGLWQRERDAYPSRLQALLGDAYAVRNFGVSGATLIKKGDRPYGQTPEVEAVSAFRPDVIIIHLGTNDAMRFPHRLESDFESDYLALVDHFAALPSRPAILVCQPVPIFFPPADRAMSEQIVPAVERVAQARGLILVNLHEALRDDAVFFPDAVHPNADGAAKIAEIVFSRLQQLRK